MNPNEIIVNCFTSTPMISELAPQKAYSLLQQWKFRPSVFSDVEPIRTNWDNEQQFVELWEQGARSFFDLVMFKRRERPKYQGHFMMRFGPKAKCHSMSMFAMKVGDFGGGLCPDLLGFVDRLFETLDFDYAFICTDAEYHAANINLNGRISKSEIEPTQVVGMQWPDCIPGFYWANYYGSLYFDQGFGANLETLDDVVRLQNGVRITNRGSILDWEMPEARASAQQCVTSLGVDWFFSKKAGMPRRRLQTDRNAFRWPKNYVAK